jgi:hypothetical protein
MKIKGQIAAGIKTMTLLGRFLRSPKISERLLFGDLVPP